ncbi:cutA homologue, putative [Plasmodium knowlesi strain H]|uniref:CutA homologue, putative n=3 Tax=Plasmodium knowlesi TaxID=5850 RepID=A0A5K1VNU1_PLAKH|nr:cutA-like protein [Plasmodium knowlesi strain H]OTN63884.1 putative CutA-like protein [Plasmodium knowlesi]CAA9991289.1 protein CutA, putative [Plasmodium knowlesi strain H]SBO26385.1 cutA homologue, putative [Plasmodium knowlesi strain H]SBO29004.1 cutA homologue, putative [Plasmodium knowlesi strain H]VVS80763.1 protein CutA, putative [Plasmodium knowlesi strain H]|eukprot:XP_002262567.1 cutA-like protein [Plasmodium knowlesi strain H]
MLISLAAATTKRCHNKLLHSLFVNNSTKQGLLNKVFLGRGRRNSSCARSFFGSKMEESTDFIAVYVTAPGTDVAEKISNVLLEDKLASCVNIIPGVLSLYHWKGEIARDNEVLMMIKTKKNLFSKIVDAVKANHPYEVPEVISVPIHQGSKDYLDWISKSVKSPSEGDKKNT